MHVGKAKLDAVASATRFTPAIVAVENEDEGDDEVHPRVLVSFFSTSTCNMTSCGMFSDVSSFITEKTRGKGMYQRKWFTENNTHRKFYLSAFSPRVLTIPAAVYGVPHDRPHRIPPPYPPPPAPRCPRTRDKRMAHGCVCCGTPGTYNTQDRVDGILVRYAMQSHSRKYWHALMAKGSCLALHVCYEMYKAFADGQADPKWSMKGFKKKKWKLMTRNEFHVRMALQKCQFNADAFHMAKYPGDSP